MTITNPSTHNDPTFDHQDDTTDLTELRSEYEKALADLHVANNGRITPRQLARLKAEWRDKGLEVW